MTLALLAAALVVSVGCTRAPAPEAVALAYGRAVYAGDAGAVWRLVSDADRRVKDEAVFRRQQHQAGRVAQEALDQLARAITASSVKTTITGDRASVTLRFRLPDANAPEIRTLLHDWDDNRLNALADAERRSIRERLERLHRDGKLPMVEGDETIELVREARGWTVFLNWAGGVAVRFEAAVDSPLPLQVSVTPASAILAPGERIRVTVRATNAGSREVTTRVGHRIEPSAQAEHLALLQCPLFVPVTLKPHETEEYTSEYLLLATTPTGVKSLAVTFRFPAPNLPLR